MLIVLVAVIANIAISFMKPGNNLDKADSKLLTAELQKKLALKLEKQGLNTISAEAWKEYISIAFLDKKETAKIWYRIGKLYQNNNEFGKALDSFYRSESFADIEEISPEINRRIQECLESMGKFAALRYELSDRVGIDKSPEDAGSTTKGDQVVAEIGLQKITESDLDRKIESQIDQQISQFASYLPEDQRNKQKEEMLKRFSTSSQRQMFLNQFILEEILYRKARESKLINDQNVRNMLKDQERSLLAKMVIDKEYSDKIKIMSSDLSTFYEANKKEYIRPERARICHILVQNSDGANYIREKLKNKEDFDELALKMSIDETTREKNGEISEWIEKDTNNYIPGIGVSEDAMNIIFATKPGNVAKEDIRTEKGIHIIKILEKEPESQKTFEEVRDEVFRTLRSQKEREIQQILLTELKAQYDVVIHQSAFVNTEPKNK